MPAACELHTLDRAPVFRSFRRKAVVGALLIVGTMAPWRSVTAQACTHPGALNLTDAQRYSYFGSLTSTSMKSWGGQSNSTGWMSYGNYREVAYPQPAVAVCDIDAASSIIEISRIFDLGATNSIGSATGGSTGGGGPFARQGSNVGNLAAGTTIVGYIDRGPSTLFHAFRWTTATGLIDIGTLDPANNANRTSTATGVNADGSVIVGLSATGAGPIQHAFRWTAAGMVDLGAPAGATRDSRALAVNGAGDVLVGDAVFADPNAFTGFRNGAFRWTATGGFQNLGALEPGYFSVATDVSADGTVIVGQGGIQIVVGNSSTNGSRAFRWTSTTGLQAIGPLSGHTHAIATGVSDNGKVVVGVSAAGPLSYNLFLGHGGGIAFRWTEAGGIQDLRQVLITASLNLTGITLVNASGVSADGQWIFGNAFHSTTPDGETRPFVARFCDAAISGPCTPLTIAPAASFNLTSASSTSPSVVAGSSVTSTLTVTPSGGFNQAVTFSCSGLPAESSCAFAPASLTPNGAAITTTLTITTTAPRAAGLMSSPWGATLALAIAGLLLGSMLTSEATRARTRWMRPVVAGIASLVVITSCGGGDGGTAPPPLTGGSPAGTFPVVVTASSGSGANAVNKTLTISLTVTR